MASFCLLTDHEIDFRERLELVLDGSFASVLKYVDEPAPAEVELGAEAVLGVVGQEVVEHPYSRGHVVRTQHIQRVVIMRKEDEHGYCDA